MNEVYIVLGLQGIEPIICDVYNSFPPAMEEFQEIVGDSKLTPIVIDSEGVKHELSGTIAIAGDDACSVQIIKRSVHL